MIILLQGYIDMVMSSLTMIAGLLFCLLCYVKVYRAISKDSRREAQTREKLLVMLGIGDCNRSRWFCHHAVRGVSSAVVAMLRSHCHSILWRDGRGGERNGLFWPLCCC